MRVNTRILRTGPKHVYVEKVVIWAWDTFSRPKVFKLLMVGMIQVPVCMAGCGSQPESGSRITNSLSHSFLAVCRHGTCYLKPNIAHGDDTETRRRLLMDRQWVCLYTCEQLPYTAVSATSLTFFRPSTIALTLLRISEKSRNSVYGIASFLQNLTRSRGC